MGVNDFSRPTFVDLFCGIGGMRLAFEQADCRCVFSCDWDSHAQKTYAANFGEAPAGNVREIRSQEIPDHDILLAGFPCQPFSISGVSKKRSLGRAHGFDDPTQGTLFFEIKRIIRDKKPEAFLLENVKNLLGHDHGRTFEIIRETLEDELSYYVDWKVLDASMVVPQHRERLFIVGFREARPFRWPTIHPKQARIADILEKETDRKYGLTEQLWLYLRNYAEKHRAAGNGFGYGLADLKGISRTLSARYYKDGSEVLIPRGKSETPRRLTPRECARLMGFPESFKIPVSDTQAYKQFGNSVVVPLVAAIAKQVVKALRSPAIRVPRQQLPLIAAQ